MLLELRAGAEPAALISLSDLVAEAMLACTDHRILGEPTITARCEVGDEIAGVEGAPCAALDSACGRGVLREDGMACCAVSLMLEGASCRLETTTGVCGVSGRCEEGAFSATGAPHWAEVTPARAAPPVLGDWFDPDGNAIVRVADTYETGALTTDAVPEYDDIAWFRAPAGAERVVMSRLRLDEAGVRGVLADTDRPGLRTLFIQGVQQEEVGDLQVAVLRAPVDSIFVLRRDGTSLPADATTLLNCSGDDRNGDLACHFDENVGLLEVSGVGLAGAFVVSPGRTEVRPAGRLRPPLDVSRRPTGPSVRDQICFPGSAEICTHSCGGLGTRTCIGQLWGPCSRPETCNGCDDDLDGLEDEGGSSICDDGASCTADICRSFLSTPSCWNGPRPYLCERGRCTQGVCAGSVGLPKGLTGAFDRLRPAAAGPTCFPVDNEVRGAGCREDQGYYPPNDTCYPRES